MRKGTSTGAAPRRQRKTGEYVLVGSERRKGGG